MNKRKTFFGIALVLAVLVLGIGYAVVANDVLTISGTATATPNDENFKVILTGTPTTDVTGAKAGSVDAKVTNETTGSITVTGLTAKDEVVTATYKIQNNSPDLTAKLSAGVTNDNTEYFEVTAEIADADLTVAEKETTVTVTVKMLKTPVEANETANITITVTAEPEQPGTTPAA